MFRRNIFIRIMCAIGWHDPIPGLDEDGEGVFCYNCGSKLS